MVVLPAKQVRKLGLIPTKEVLEKLREKKVEMSKSTLLSYRNRGLIPPSINGEPLQRPTKRTFWVYWRPETVDIILDIQKAKAKGYRLKDIASYRMPPGFSIEQHIVQRVGWGPYIRTVQEGARSAGTQPIVTEALERLRSEGFSFAPETGMNK